MVDGVDHLDGGGVIVVARGPRVSEARAMLRAVMPSFTELAERALAEGRRVTVDYYRVRRSGSSFQAAKDEAAATAVAKTRGIRLVRVFDAVGALEEEQPLERAEVLRLHDLGAVYNRDPDDPQETGADDDAFWIKLRGY